VTALQRSSDLRESADVAAGKQPRSGYIDVFRGLLIAHMALDHASLMFNAGRGGEELAALPPSFSDDLLQFVTRFTGIPVAPAFCFMAGFMVAMTSLARASRGVAHSEITRRLIIRGCVLIAADAIIMGLPRALMGFYSFMVLSCIGVAIILLALVRDAPTKILLPTALGVLLLHPLLDVSSMPVALQAILYEPVREGPVRSMYPLIPWAAIVVVGFVVGRDALSRTDLVRFWLKLSAVCLISFFAIRLNGHYGNAFAYSSVMSREFWFFSKYPPDLPFLAWSFALTFLTLAVLKAIAGEHVPTLFKPLEAFGRVPFFFYLVHFYVLGIAQAILRTKVDLATTYLIWTALLIVMTWPCVWYYRKKRDRPNIITRYL
jgi:uncharacterized membrane protein